PIVAAVAAALAVAAVLALVLAMRPERSVVVNAPSVPAVAAPVPNLATTHLVLDVTPDDASVLVDGVVVPGPAPFVVTDLAIGPHSVEVRRAGFVPLVKVIEVRRDGLHLPLDLDVADVVLGVVVDPITAEVRVVSAGREIARGTGSQRFAMRRSAGEDVTLEVSAPGFQPRSVPVRFSGAAQEEIAVSLVRDASTPAPPSGTVAKPRPRSPDLKDPFHGSRRDGGEDGGTGSFLKDPFSKSGAAPAATRSATLRVGVIAGLGPATVTIDGDVVGTTPITGHEVKPGKHRIRWEWRDGRVFEQSIAIAANEVKLLKGG
ncbi:MAG TPA: PEGA domain-containing protein, partial [Nannocystaceae bacterium]|nr:PEGA domain-containing protein [Nannocystaceae bacterium]